jgi:predicted ATPase/DNA-binding SARP family transcriptional activator
VPEVLMRPAGDALEFRVMGPIEVLRGGQPIPLGGAKEQAVLAALLIARNRFVSADALIEMIWEENAPASARQTLRSYLSRLRGRLRPVSPEKQRSSFIEHRSGAYQLAAADDTVDSSRFEAAVSEGRQALEALDPALASRRLRAALALWRGVPYGDLRYWPVAAREADRLDEMRLASLELLSQAEIALGHADGATSMLEQLVHEDPVREHGWALLVEALARQGRWAEALRAGEKARVALRHELGVEPGPELQSLLVKVHERDIPALLPRAQGIPPRPLTGLVGRRDEVRRLLTMLARGGLLTVVGPAGIGKTRLALEVAQRHREVTGPASVIWIDLVALAGADDLPGSIAAALGAAEPTPSAGWVSVAATLGREPPVLMLDSCDRLIPACASLARGLLENHPGACILATSREALGVPGEQIVPLAPLDAPPEGVTDPRGIAASPAVQLLVQRAAEARPGFAVTSQNAADLAAIARRLDGLPLAIDLAGGRLRTLSPAELLGRLHDRFRLLSGTAGSRIARHQTLFAAISWGHDLMSEPEQIVFRRLSVFRGSFGLAEAEAVCGGGSISDVDVTGLLGRLVDRSMLLAEPTERATRFRLLETLRDFAADLAGRHEDVDGLRRRHLRAYRRLVQRTEPALRGPQLLDGLADLDTDRANIAAALEWAVEASGEGDQALGLAGSLWRYWLKRGLVREGLDWLNLALARAPLAAAASVAWAETAATMLATVIGLPEAKLHADRAVEQARRAGDAQVVAWARIMRSLHAARSGAPEAARRDAQSALGSLRSITDVEATATAEAAIGMAAKYEGKLEEARSRFERALELYEELGDHWDAGWALVNLADVAVRRLDVHEGRAFARKALQRFRSTGDRRAFLACRLLHARAHLLAGEGVKAEATLHDALAMARRYGYASEANQASQLLVRLVDTS